MANRRYDNNYDPQTRRVDPYAGADLEEPTPSRSTIRIQKQVYNPNSRTIESDPQLTRSHLRPASVPARTTAPQQSVQPMRDRHQVQQRYTEETERLPAIPAQQPKQSRHSRRGFILTCAGVGIGFYAAAQLGVNWTKAEINNLNYIKDEAQFPRAKPLFLRCGHNDDISKGQPPTEIDAFLVGSGSSSCVAVMELPGGSKTTHYTWFSPSLSSLGYTGNPADIKISLNAQKVTEKKYQIEIRVYFGMYDTEGRPTLLIDAGDHFEPAK